MRRLLIVPLCLAMLAGCQAGSHAAAPAQSEDARLRLATWNLQWLVDPAAAAALVRDCVPDGASPGRRERSLPCSAVASADRSSADLQALARYAQRLDADVVALQEVDGPGAAARVFPGYRFCFTRRRALQNTGFAVRRGIPHRCGADLEPLSLDNSLRTGAELILYPGTPRELWLLSVHLKSGCANRTLDSARPACRTLARQVPALERWIDAQAAAGRRFAVLGDFNRDLLDDPGPARNARGELRSLWAEIDDAQPAESDLVNPAEGQRFVNCTPFQGFRAYIDHIVLSKSLANARVPNAFSRLTYDARDATRLRLSDHCPVAVDLHRGH